MQKYVFLPPTPVAAKRLETMRLTIVAINQNTAAIITAPKILGSIARTSLSNSFPVMPSLALKYSLPAISAIIFAPVAKEFFFFRDNLISVMLE